jgi:hypothetical protein
MNNELSISIFKECGLLEIIRTSLSVTYLAAQKS